MFTYNSQGTNVSNQSRENIKTSSLFQVLRLQVGEGRLRREGTGGLAWFPNRLTAIVRIEGAPTGRKQIGY